MKKLMSLVGLVLLVLSVSAQVDQKAKSILEEVTQKTQSYTSIQATFDYILDNKEMEIHEENKGTISMKGDMYLLKLTELGLEIYCNGKEVSSYMKDANEVTISPVDSESGDMMNPSKIFTIYENGFSYKFVEEKVIGGKSCYVIDLFPENDDIEYTKIRIMIDKQQMLISKAEMAGADGNTYIIDVKDMKTNAGITDDVFTFNVAKHPGVDVIDLR
ncbi:outer membrane lipoprotein carrier protein LolA [Mangrovibacterium marinum]|uniref:Outer membrane lipoprotein-sorting protein n=1 Tax=Mangrovibacterium marinum TaxID=1639118 RepID=A0A2T5C3P1_9BACT|nr:outer membrane lipoprotein carrier protein LolA [Mangrovibacterium marinum]PTN09381.1 outer membrane lipoprotein-sorting protein [Mangrovibacterium marinum]